MDFVRTLLLMTVLMSTLVGCGEEPIPEPPAPPTALSPEEWSKMLVPEKYDGGTLDRLRMYDPKHKSDAAWDKYMREVVFPQRLIDIPPNE